MGKFVDHLEESIIAVLLAGMTLVTFSQVVARYMFNSGWVSALELTVFLFDWLVLFGISWGVKVNTHIGVDAICTLLPKKGQRVLAVITGFCCMAYCVIMFWGSWVYWSKMFKIGLVTADLGIPRWVPLAILPIGLILLLVRFAQATWQVIQGKRESMIASHQGEDAHIQEAVVDGAHKA